MYINALLIIMCDTNMKISVLTLSIVFIAVTATVNGQCTTPSGVDGECTVIEECPSLAQLVKTTNRMHADTDLLRQSACGFDGDIPKVCCPKPCTAADGQQGQCVNIYSCPHIVNMLKRPLPNKNRLFIQKSKCHSNDVTSVCCGPPVELTEEKENATKETPCEKNITAFPPNPKCKLCGFDISGPNRILGGNHTAIDQYPWLTLIEYESKNKTLQLLCGGALISAKYVLTAAHCVTGVVLNIGKPTNVRLGEYDTSTDVDCDHSSGYPDCAPPVVINPIEKITHHPEYEDLTRSRHDIALIRMRDNAPYTDFIRPICLPTKPDVTVDLPEHFLLYVAGWGYVDSSHKNSNIKLHVAVPLVNQKNCQPQYTKRNVELWKGQMCAGGEIGKDSCKGDSGGPLMYEDEDGHFEILGVVSFGPFPCGKQDVPSVYTKVFEYLNWINSNIEP